MRFCVVFMGDHQATWL